MRIVRVTICFMLILIVALLSLVARCFYLQYFRNSHYNSQSVHQKRMLVTEYPQRGEILDRRGRVLGASNKYKTIKAERRIIKDAVKPAGLLAPILNIEGMELCRMIEQSRNPGSVKLKENASEEECRQARKIYGIGVDTYWRRYYPMGSLASHIVGFTSIDNRGLGGVELECNSQLSGQAGRDILLADSRRRPIRLLKQSERLEDGSGIILTIDTTIQQFTRSALLEQYEAFEAEAAMAIVAEPHTGAILAMVSLPDYDPENISSADPESLRNRAITDQFEPGSIFKPITVALALDAGLVNKTEKIFCEDGHYYGKGFGRIGEYRNHRYGNMTIKEILVKSSNIGVAKIGQRLGKDRLYTGIRRFGFGKRTGIDLPGEVEGFMWPVGKWTGYSVTRVPFGQEITVTAIQVVRAFCILANGGHAVQPFVVRAMVDHKGKITKLKRQKLPSVGYVIKPEVAKWVVGDALAAVINEGTGKRARLDKWQIFGKTGTANIAKSNERGYSDSDYVASFVAGGPAEDPRIVVLVSIRKPNKKLGKGYTGGAVASPVAAKIIEKTLTYLDVPSREVEDQD
ncbi:MAG: peptidoglycan D,D-transpeptidase FtsI family protein [Planctomycetota bacterium]